MGTYNLTQQDEHERVEAREQHAEGSLDLSPSLSHGISVSGFAEVRADVVDEQPNTTDEQPTHFTTHRPHHDNSGRELWDGQTIRRSTQQREERQC